MPNSQVVSMTVDELKAVIGEVIDERFRQLLSIVNITSLAEASSLATIDTQVSPQPHITVTITPSLSDIGTMNPQMIESEVVGEHPWLKLTGVYKDNPLFDEVVAEMEAQRQKINASEISSDLGTDTKGSMV